MGTDRGARDVVAAHPGFDWVVPVGVAAAWIAMPDAFIPAASETRVQLYVAAATVAALVLAAATFVCALVYQAGSDYAVRVRTRFAAELRRNWTSIITSSLLAALLPIVAIAVDEHNAVVASALTVFSLGVVVSRFARTTWWLRFVLLVQRESDSRPAPYVVRSDDRLAG